MQKLKDKWQLIAVVILILADLVGAYPVYETAMADPMANLPPAPVVPPVIQLEGDDKTEAVVNKVPRPGADLYAWNPFYQPLIQKVVVVEEVGPAIEPGTTPAPTEMLTIQGVIKFNGAYRALVVVGEEPPAEVRKGQPIEGTEGLFVVDIRRDGVIVGKEGHINAFVRIEQPSLEGTAWYQSENFDAVRGEVVFKK